MAMSTECRNAPGMRRNAASTPEASVTAALMRRPSVSACATAARTAVDAASALIARLATLWVMAVLPGRVGAASGHHAEEGRVQLAVVIEDARADLVPGPGDGLHVGVVVVAAGKGL